MPRKRTAKDPCDCIDCRETFPADIPLGTAVARQQPPPKCLIVHLPSCYRCSFGFSEKESESNPLPSIPHIEAAVRDGCSGLLAIRRGRGASSPEGKQLENIFCLTPVGRQPEGKGAEERGSVLRNLAAELVTASEEYRAIGCDAGFTTAHALPDISRSESSTACLSDDALQALSALIADRLGLESLRQRQTLAPPEEDGRADLLFVCLEPATSCLRSMQQHDVGGLQTVDKLLQSLNGYTGFRDSVLLVLLLGVTGNTEALLPQPGGAALGIKGFQGVSRPRQSFEFAALDEVQIDRQQAILSVQRLPFVIRKDKQQQLPRSLKSFCPGHGCILAERLLPEIAYKLACAPKYGA